MAAASQPISRQRSPVETQQCTASSFVIPGSSIIEMSTKKKVKRASPAPQKTVKSKTDNPAQALQQIKETLPFSIREASSAIKAGAGTANQNHSRNKLPSYTSNHTTQSVIAS